MSKNFAKSLGSGRVGWLCYMGCGADYSSRVVLFFSHLAPRKAGAHLPSAPVFFVPTRQNSSDKKWVEYFAAYPS